MFVRVGQSIPVDPRSPYPLVPADVGIEPVEGLGGCGCAGASGIRTVGRVDPSGLGASPDGLGASPPLFGTITGSAIGDALLTGAAGFFAAPSEDDRKLWAAGGALVGGLAGTLGLVALVGAALWVRKPRIA